MYIYDDKTESIYIKNMNGLTEVKVLAIILDADTGVVLSAGDASAVRELYRLSVWSNLYKDDKFMHGAKRVRYAEIKNPNAEDCAELNKLAVGDYNSIKWLRQRGILL